MSNTEGNATYSEQIPNTLNVYGINCIYLHTSNKLKLFFTSLQIELWSFEDEWPHKLMYLNNLVPSW